MTIVIIIYNVQAKGSKIRLANKNRIVQNLKIWSTLRGGKITAEGMAVRGPLKPGGVNLCSNFFHQLLESTTEEAIKREIEAYSSICQFSLNIQSLSAPRGEINAC